MGAFGLGGWLAVAAARGRVLAANLALHPDEPDGGVWADRRVLVANLALHPDEPDGGVWTGWLAGGRCRATRVSHQPCAPSGRAGLGACVVANLRSGQASVPRLLFWFHSRDATHTG